MLLGQKAQVAWREVAREGVLVEPEEGRVVVLNWTGTAIWRWLEQRMTVEELIERMQKEFGLTCLQAKEDLDEFINDLISRSLIEVIN